MQTTETKISKVTAWSFRLPEELLESFKEAAKASSRSAAGELRHLMEKRVAEHEAADRQPLESGKAA